jgi:hypothetical protein
MNLPTGKLGAAPRARDGHVIAVSVEELDA